MGGSGSKSTQTQEENPKKFTTIPSDSPKRVSKENFPSILSSNVTSPELHDRRYTSSQTLNHVSSDLGHTFQVKEKNTNADEKAVKRVEQSVLQTTYVSSDSQAQRRDTYLARGLRNTTPLEQYSKPSVIDKKESQKYGLLSEDANSQRDNTFDQREMQKKGSHLEGNQKAPKGMNQQGDSLHMSHAYADNAYQHQRLPLAENKSSTLSSGTKTSTLGVAPTSKVLSNSIDFISKNNEVTDNVEIKTKVDTLTSVSSSGLTRGSDKLINRGLKSSKQIEKDSEMKNKTVMSFTEAHLDEEIPGSTTAECNDRTVHKKVTTFEKFANKKPSDQLSQSDLAPRKEMNWTEVGDDVNLELIISNKRTQDKNLTHVTTDKKERTFPDPALVNLRTDLPLSTLKEMNIYGSRREEEKRTSMQQLCMKTIRTPISDYTQPSTTTGEDSLVTTGVNLLQQPISANVNSPKDIFSKSDSSSNEGLQHICSGAAKNEGEFTQKDTCELSFGARSINGKEKSIDETSDLIIEIQSAPETDSLMKRTRRDLLVIANSDNCCREKTILKSSIEDVSPKHDHQKKQILLPNPELRDRITAAERASSVKHRIDAKQGIVQKEERHLMRTSEKTIREHPKTSDDMERSKKIEMKDSKSTKSANTCTTNSPSECKSSSNHKRSAVMVDHKTSKPKANNIPLSKTGKNYHNGMEDTNSNKTVTKTQKTGGFQSLKVPNSGNAEEEKSPAHDICKTGEAKKSFQKLEFQNSFSAITKKDDANTDIGHGIKSAKYETNLRKATSENMKLIKTNPEREKDVSRYVVGNHSVTDDKNQDRKLESSCITTSQVRESGNEKLPLQTLESSSEKIPSMIFWRSNDTYKSKDELSNGQRNLQWIKNNNPKATNTSDKRDKSDKESKVCLSNDKHSNGKTGEENQNLKANADSNRPNEDAMVTEPVNNNTRKIDREAKCMSFGKELKGQRRQKSMIKHNKSVPVKCLPTKVTRDDNEQLHQMPKRNNRLHETSKRKEVIIQLKLQTIIETEFEVLRCFAGIITETQFSIDDVQPDFENLTTTVRIKFPSIHMSRRFQCKLSKGRKDMPFSCSISGDQGSQRYRISFESLLECIHSKARIALNKHARAMTDLEVRLENLNIQSQRMKGKFMSPDVFFQMQEERKTLEEKHDEFCRQKAEFQNYLRNTSSLLEEFMHDGLSESQSGEIRKNVEIECVRLDEALPLYARKTEIIETISEHPVSIILGETGSGKSTQIAQYLHQSGIAGDGLIVCTQPRKVAAISLASRVASEMKTSVGHLVGYQVGMSVKKTQETRIVYMTDHMLLNECLHDSLLSAFSVIIIDEAHERSIFTDLLLGMIKSCLKKRKDLHVVVTSATIDPDVFVKFFDGCPVLKVSGRIFPVEIVWQKSSTNGNFINDYEDRAVEKAIDIHESEPEGDILVFLTSQLEIERCVRKFENRIGRTRTAAQVLPLHGKLQPDEQRCVFQPERKGTRKVIFATNIAETSITIPGVRYVVDTGVVKEMQYDPQKKISSLEVTMVTKSSSDQRKGRAGRTRPGKCFRLFSEVEFENMKPNSVPEILKIHLGHAMLKLLELNIDPLEFDFVQAPTTDLMEDAVSVLENIGAVSDRKITEKGRWIAKLHLEPRLSALIYSAIQNDAAIEGIVLAASCTASGSLFYRAGSEEEKQKADKLKIPFCHSAGDHMTALNVFKEWHKVPEKGKGKWCKTHSINGKVVRGIRETATEVIKILKKEYDLVIKFELTDDSKNERILQKLLFKAFQENICHFMGHHKAGYHFIDKDQNIVVHPSSSFLSLGLLPDWVIVEQVMRTSRDFALNITAVQEEDVLEAINDGSLRFDLEVVKKKRVTPVCTEFVGSHLHQDFVGPRYSKLKDMEASLKDTCEDSLFVVDADRDRGEICIYATRENEAVSTQTLQGRLDPLRTKLKEEKREIPLSENAFFPKALIGPGGGVIDIFYSDENKSVLVYFGKTSTDMSESEVKRIFSVFGEINRCVPKSINNKSKSYWGEIVFQDAKSAGRALLEMQEDRDLRIRPKPLACRDDLETKLVWTRRPSEGYGFVEFKTESVVHRARISSPILVGVNLARAAPSKKNPNEIYLKGLGRLVTEDVLRESIIAHLGLQQDDIKRVTVVRKRVQTSQEMLTMFGRRLNVEIGKYVDKNRFTLRINTPNEKDHNYTAMATFSNPDDGNTACQNISGIFVLNGETVSMIPKLHASLFIQNRVFVTIEKDLKAFIATVDASTTVQVKRLRNNNIVVDINSERVEDLATVKRSVENIVKGIKLDVEELTSCSHLFTREGRRVIGEIMRKTATEIITDGRSMSIYVHGSPKKRLEAHYLLHGYLEEFNASTFRVVDLRSVGKPPGLMKAVVIQYGFDLERLVQRSELLAANLDYKNHKVTLVGNDESIKSAQSLITDISEKLTSQMKDKPTAEYPECGICLCEIEDEPMYRLESCGHPYCLECIKMHLESSVTTADFPIKCCAETCDSLWAWQDIFNLSKRGFSTIRTVMRASVSNFVQRSTKSFRYCITPDCHMVYRVSNDGSVFVCPECRVRICTSCHVENHSGMSCSKYKMETGQLESGIYRWLQKDTQNRKLCPKCGAGIEKTGGCQHMSCPCGSHICWICMAVFLSSGECYGHMQREHRTFV